LEEIRRGGVALQRAAEWDENGSDTCSPDASDTRFDLAHQRFKRERNAIGCDEVEKRTAN
jgi:hypothetical protein